jgi:hypothetical protein
MKTVLCTVAAIDQVLDSTPMILTPGVLSQLNLEKI